MDIKKFLPKQKTIDIAEALPDAVLYIDNAGAVHWGNDTAHKVFEVAKEDGFAYISMNDLVENGLTLVKNAEKNNKAFIGKSTIKEEYYEITAKTADNGYVVSFRDSTQNYKRISGILAEKESTNNITRDKNEFLIKLYNKFNSPLQSIIGFSQGLIDGIGGKPNDKQKRYLEIIKANSLELSHFFNKLIELSQAESNMFPKESKYFDIVTLINNTIKSIIDNYETKSLNISFNVDNELKRTIYQNEPVCKVITQNLIEAIAREMEIGTIQVSLVDTTDDFLTSRNLPTIPSVLLSISSLNLQIVDNELPILFNPYATIDTLNRNAITRALALGTVKNLAKSIGGVAWVENVPMQGPVFNIIIPREKNINE